MDIKEAIRISIDSIPARQAFNIETRGGYCPNVNLQSNIALVVACYKKDRVGVFDRIEDYPFYRLAYNIAGKIIMNDGKKNYNIGPGTVYCFKPGESSTAKCIEGPWVHYIVNFIGKESRKLVEQTPFATHRYITTTSVVDVESILKAIVEESLTREPYLQEICENYLRILLLKLAHAANHTNVSQEYESFLKCKLYVDENYLTLYSPSQIAEGVYISQQHLQRLFKKYLRVTPYQYMNNLKMNKAAVALLETNRSIAEISKESGFPDPLYFSTRFKMIYGSSPRKFRKSHIS
jgi:AraC-like DNA-binding protein